MNLTMSKKSVIGSTPVKIVMIFFSHLMTLVNILYISNSPLLPSRATAQLCWVGNIGSAGSTGSIQLIFLKSATIIGYKWRHRLHAPDADRSTGTLS